MLSVVLSLTDPVFSSHTAEQVYSPTSVRVTPDSVSMLVVRGALYVDMEVDKVLDMLWVHVTVPCFVR